MSEKSLARMRERYGDALLTTLAIMMAILMFVAGPLRAVGLTSAHFFGLPFGLVLVVSVFVVSGSRIAVGAVLIAFALIAGATFLRLRQVPVVDIYLEAAAWLIVGLTLSIVVLRAVFGPGKVSFHRIIGAVLLYLNFGLIFAAVFCFVALHTSDAFSGIRPLQDDFAVAANMVYFSFVTLTTTGYGDIVPLHPFARSLANLEAVIGQLYPATLLARIVTLELEHRRSR